MTSPLALRWGALLLALLPAPLQPSVPLRAPGTITITTAHGDARLPVVDDSAAGPSVPGDALVAALNGAVQKGQPWVEVSLARQSFRFLLGAPVLLFNDRLQPLVGWAHQSNDSLFLPLQFVTEVLPSVLAERYAWDPVEGRLRETAPPAPPVVATRPPPARRTPAAPERLPNGLLPGHVVTVDAGHGGIDEGNPGYYFPRGLKEKDVTLQVAFLLRDELLRRGVKVIMTRTTDTLISRKDRAPLCTAACDLFLSLHVDALDKSVRRRWGAVSGFHTIIIGEENTEDADRIARMENDALRFETDTQTESGGLDFILGNLQMNEYLRESARAAELVQSEVARVHTGEDRGVKQSRVLAVLNTARRPAILVEMGFATNPNDARLLTNRKSQRALATAMADAVVAYLLDYERKTASAGSGRGR